ncbi:lipolytic protein G-D-S-L family [Neobacillus bataviensis LMG 21833]|uniref:Lipolytic protein G-D-S-L family n=1 Tax=Neobacillus bataviensis LMG 21833 TaxID=1117379 RepID=K6C4T9_9BACI|nr:GDSL-type esterase/lipase family protein [Neobacillus bataviensis]EKN66135.1 lipolytic protein G-D-S-L family [Neobacillus bataviensis LMG 21833]
MKFKRLSVLFALLLILSTCFSSLAFATDSDKPSLVALGDSITHGWNLDGDYSPTQPVSQNAFPFLIADRGFNVTNISNGGWTSADILAQVKNSANEESIKTATIFTLNIGNNDLMKAVGLSDILKNGTPVDPETLKPNALIAASQLGENLIEIFKRIRSLNPTAPIILYNLYNPFGESDIPFNKFLNIIGEDIVSGVNKDVIAPFKAAPGIFVADSYSVFNGKQSEYVNQFPFDPIHPTVKGHQTLAGLATGIVDSLLPKDEPLSVELTPSTTEQVNDKVTINVKTNTPNVTVMLWLPGEKVATDFLTSGTPIIDNKFDATENGKYSILIMDNKQRVKVQIIEITNISKDDPVKGNPDPIPGDSGSNNPAPDKNTPTTPVPDNNKTFQPTPISTNSGATKTTTTKSGNTLPDTATSMFNYIALGLGLMGAGLVVMELKRRRKESM